MPLKRLTHERYARMRADGTMDAYQRELDDKLRAKGIDPTLPALPEPPTPAPVDDDLPAITETRPTWWQVRRIEQDVRGDRRHVLIYECRDETTAMGVCLSQRWRCRVSKWGDKQKPYENFKPVKVIAEVV